MVNSRAEENYLKAIFKLSEKNSDNVFTNDIALMLRTKAASVTDMLTKLHAKKIVDYQRYKNFTLTDTGNKLALEIIRKHRLWEFFLVNKLGFQWDQVHDIAEELEHISSKELVTKLDNYLDYPSFDPHGDPIPDKNGKLKPKLIFEL